MKKITLKNVKDLIYGKVDRIDLGSGEFMEAYNYGCSGSFFDEGVYTNRGFSCCFIDYIDKKCGGDADVYFEDNDYINKALKYMVYSFNKRQKED